MRSVTLQGHYFTVTDDPDSILSDFLGFAVSDPDLSAAAIVKTLTPPNGGHSTPEETGAYPIESADDIPDSFRFAGITTLPEGEWWVVWRDRRGRGSLDMLVLGDELRALVTQADALWKASHTR